ncbi:MAG: hypothetical protein CM1200mP30_25900 [Pseudomonadota bacterium]|nr:MAG: hypothetical protein CM1200mP30_25900 [Pseudomonadota bacterium]
MEKIEDILLSAKEALIQKRTDESIELFSEVLKIDPDNRVCFIQRGTAYYTMKEYQKGTS